MKLSGPGRTPQNTFTGEMPSIPFHPELAGRGVGGGMSVISWAADLLDGVTAFQHGPVQDPPALGETCYYSAWSLSAYITCWCWLPLT